MELPGVRTIHAKAKPTATATAFCFYVNLLKKYLLMDNPRNQALRKQQQH